MSLVNVQTKLILSLFLVSSFNLLITFIAKTMSKHLGVRTKTVEWFVCLQDEKEVYTIQSE